MSGATAIPGHATVEVDGDTVTAERRVRGPWLLTLVVLLLSVVTCAAIIATIQVQARHKATYLEVPFGALIGWLAGRLVFRRTWRVVALAVVLAVLIAVLADYATATWAYSRAGVTSVSAVAQHPLGMLRFLVDTEWKLKDYALWVAAAVAAAVLSWPPARVTAAGSAEHGD